MKKVIKWGLIGVVTAAIIAGGYWYQQPKVNKELAEAGGKPGGPGGRGGMKILNVNGKLIKPQQLTDEFRTTGLILPDEEVDLSFETSGKIIAIKFNEGTTVHKGQLLAKVNDKPLQAQL